MKHSKPERLIYIGPTLSGKRLLAYTVFIGIPEEAKRIAAKEPWFMQLFVPVSDMRKKTAEASRKGTPLYLYYRKAMEV